MSYRHNFQGQSFQGQNLTGADFSNTDIRGTDFSRTILRGANFSGAHAGLTPRWEIFWLVAAILLSLVSGMICGFAGSAIQVMLTSGDRLYFIAGIVSLVVVGLFFLLAIAVRLLAAIAFIALVVFIAFIVAMILILLGLGSGIAGIVVTAVVTIVGVITLAGVIARSVAGSRGSYLTFAAAVVGGIIAGQNLGSAIGVILVVLLSAYMTQSSFKGNKRYELIYNTAIALTTLKGTSFQDANLTQANFSYAIVKNSDFRQAILRKTHWKNAKHLRRARFTGETPLSNS
ncbi:MAG: pentapeptide repeat-containing protein [Chroococcales cyanobacterium]